MDAVDHVILCATATGAVQRQVSSTLLQLLLLLVLKLMLSQRVVLGVVVHRGRIRLHPRVERVVGGVGPSVV